MKVHESTNKRYKLVEMNAKYYLLDLDSHKFCWFLPMLVWLFPFKAIEIDKVRFDELITNRKAGYGVVQIVILSIVIGRPSTWLINTFFQNYVTISGVRLGTFYLFVVLALLISYRAINAIFNKHRMYKNIGNSREGILIRINKESITSYYKRNSAIAFLIIYLAIFSSGYFSVFYSFDMIVIFIICVLFSLFLNRGYIYPYGSNFSVQE